MLRTQRDCGHPIEGYLQRSHCDIVVSRDDCSATDDRAGCEYLLVLVVIEPNLDVASLLQDHVYCATGLPTSFRRHKN